MTKNLPPWHANVYETLSPLVLVYHVFGWSLATYIKAEQQCPSQLQTYTHSYLFLMD